MSNLMIHRIKIKAKKFRALPDQVRHFIIIAGHSLNELNMIYRCILASDHEFATDSTVEKNVMLTQHLFFLRLHLSKCHEIWEVYKRFKNVLAAYEAPVVKSDLDLRSSKDFLTKFFSGRNIATIVRKGFGFHYPTKFVPQFPLSQFDDDDEFEVFIHSTRLNSHFFMCDFLCYRIMEKEIFGNVDDEKLEERMNEIFEKDMILNGHILAFFDGILGYIMGTSLGIELEKAERVILVDVPTMSQPKLSFFLDTEEGQT